MGRLDHLEQGDYDQQLDFDQYTRRREPHLDPMTKIALAKEWAKKHGRPPRREMFWAPQISGSTGPRG